LNKKIHHIDYHFFHEVTLMEHGIKRERAPLDNYIFGCEYVIQKVMSPFYGKVKFSDNESGILLKSLHEVISFCKERDINLCFDLSDLDGNIKQLIHENISKEYI